MPCSIDKIFISLGFILVFTLLIGTHAGVAIDVAYPERLLVSMIFSYLNFIN